MEGPLLMVTSPVMLDKTSGHMLPDAMTSDAIPKGHEEHVAVLEDAIAELAKDGRREFQDRRTPLEASLRRRKGLFGREFMTVWVDHTGSLVTDDIGKEARFPFGT